MIGDTIDGRYRVLRVLGEGGMGAVYEAEHTGTGRRVAVKVIHAQMARDSETVARFQREARAAGAIETPHIVQILDTGTDTGSGVVYMVMELLRGEDLQHLIRRLGTLPPLLALRLVGQAAVGLGKAHEARVIHRDIKPANLFLSRQESGALTVKVVDFGIAKINPTADVDEQTGLTRTGGMIGSPRYMSPEQAMGKKTIDHRTDIWSLGIALYQALAGRVPHDTGSFLEIVMAICSEPTPLIQDVAPWVPPEIARIVHRMLALAPEARFQTMAEVLEAIRPLVPEGLAVEAGALVPLTDAERAHVAPRAVLEVEAGRARPAELGPPSSSAPAGGVAALSVSQGTSGASASQKRSSLVPAIGLSLVIGAAGLVAYGLTGRDGAIAKGGGPVVAALPAIASPAPSAAPAPPDDRTVRLAVEPADATVEVDGRATPVNDGGIELRGANGSVHHVRVVKGAQETGAEVAITSLGAVPPRVQVETAAPKTPARPSPGGADAGRSPPGAPGVKPKLAAPATRFE